VDPTGEHDDHWGYPDLQEHLGLDPGAEDTLYTRLLDLPDGTSVPGGNQLIVNMDYQRIPDQFNDWLPANTLIGMWSDDAGGQPRDFDLVYDFGDLGVLDELIAYRGTDGSFALASTLTATTTTTAWS